MTQERYAKKEQFDRLVLKVDLLDKELSLLKAQIQATLLAIQEHILTGTYPVLADDAERRASAQARQWNVKKFGLDQIKAVPAVLTADMQTEMGTTPPFDPPILTDDDLYPPPSSRRPAEYSDWQDLEEALNRGYHPPNGSHNGAREHTNGNGTRAASQDWMQENGHLPTAPNRPSPGWQQGSDQQPMNDSPLAEMLERLGFKRPAPGTPERNGRAEYRNAPGYQESPEYPASLSSRQQMPDGSYQQESGGDSQQASLQVWLELDKWVSEKVKEVGIAGALELAHLYGGQERETLLKLVAIYQERLANSGASVAPPPIPARPQPVQPVQPPPPNDIPWKNQAEASNAKYATYRPFGEHQELVLQLLEQVLRTRETLNPPTNGTQLRR